MSVVHYKHRDCRQTTTVTGFRVYQLANPFCLCMGATVCAHCGFAVPLSSVKFRKHNETVAKYRQRMRQRRWWVWLVVPGLMALGYFWGGDVMIANGAGNAPPIVDRCVAAMFGLMASFVVAPIVYHLTNFSDPVEDIEKRRMRLSKLKKPEPV